MIEYEYSKEVSNLNYYIEYCEKNGYALKTKNQQIRTIYRNSNGTMARITVNYINDTFTSELDFKDDKLSDEELTIRKETLPIKFTDYDAVNSILDFLNYKKDNTLKRFRYVYTKGKVKFEFDEYLLPQKKYVVALEGEKKQVDRIWKEVTKKEKRVYKNIDG